MIVRLRGHHLLCLMTYIGRGYTPDFVANYDRIVARLNAGEQARLVEGPDDICAPMLGEAQHHCRYESVAIRDADARATLARLFGGRFSLEEPFDLSAPVLVALRDAFAAGTSRAACAGCQWTALCDEIAAGGFRRVRLTGTAGTISPPCGPGTRD